jgi:hypothetical protein
VRAVPRLCEFYPGICLTTEEKARKNLSQAKKNLSQVKKNLSQSTVTISWCHSEPILHLVTASWPTRVTRVLQTHINDCDGHFRRSTLYKTELQCAWFLATQRQYVTWISHYLTALFLLILKLKILCIFLTTLFQYCSQIYMSGCPVIYSFEIFRQIYYTT